MEVPEQSPNDKLAYRLLSFENGFEALLVASGDEKKSAAAASVCVGAGSFSDPQGRCEGLAHYLEHMLFMGSGRYPGEDEMEEFLAKHGGYSNAFTDSAHTCYYLEVNKAQLHTAVDMLAQFFVAPLMKTDSAARELNAIESEFRLTQNSDGSRVEQLCASFAREGHPFRTFGWGNLESLKEAPAKAGVDINEELRAFFSAHYRAPRLRLCVFGIEAIDELQEAVLESFSGLPPAAPSEVEAGCSPQEALLAAAGKPYEVATLPKLLRARPVKDAHKLSMSWQLPPVQHLYMSKPAHYLQHLIGHEGAGSVLSWLKQQGIATQLSAGVADDDVSSSSMCCVFNVDITLTAKGLDLWPEAVRAVLIYLEMMRREGPQKWVHEELVQTQEMGWRFLEESNPTDYVQYLSCQMRPDLKIKGKHLLRAPWMTPEWDPAAIDSLLSEMVPERCVMVILSSAYGRATKASAGDGGGEGGEDDAEGDAEGEEEDEEEEDEEDAAAGGDASEAEAAGPQAKDPFFDPASAGPPSVEPLFGTEFWEAPQKSVRQLLADIEAGSGPAEATSEGLAAQARAALRLPDRNRYIATDFDLRPPPAGGELAPPPAPPGASDGDGLRGIYRSFPLLPEPLPGRPERLPIEKAGLRAWHMQDTVFATPRTELWLKFATDEAPLNPKSATSHVALVLLVRVLSDSLNETAYLAEQASLHLRVSTQNYGFDLCVGGFHHKLPLLLEAGLEQCLAFGDASTWERRLSDPTFLARLEAQREQMLRGYRNAYMRPGDHAADLRRCLLMHHRHPAQDSAQALEGVDVKQLAAFAQELIPKLRVEALMMGNATSADAAELIHGLPAQLRGDKPEAVKHPRLDTTLVPLGKATVVVADSPDAGNPNVAAEMYWQIGPVTTDADEVRQTALLGLLEGLMSEPLFDSLRTKQQLGYVVSCGMRATQRVFGFSVWLLSNKVGVAELCRRVEAFLVEFRQHVQEMSAEDFERHVVSLAAQKLEPDRTLLSSQGSAWGELQDKRYVFDRYTREAVALAGVTYQDVLQLLDRYILPGAAERRLLLIGVVGGRAKTTRAAELEAFGKDYPGHWQVDARADFLAGTSVHEGAD